MPKYTGNAKKDFPEETAALLPALVAANVTDDYAETEQQRKELEAHLNDKFNKTYKANSRLGKKFVTQSARARDLLISFMRHWSEAWLKFNYPEDYSKRIKTYESQIFEFTRRPTLEELKKIS